MSVRSYTFFKELTAWFCGSIKKGKLLTFFLITALERDVLF